MRCYPCIGHNMHCCNNNKLMLMVEALYRSLDKIEWLRKNQDKLEKLRDAYENMAETMKELRNENSRLKEENKRLRELFGMFGLKVEGVCEDD